ncbi:MAG: DapH/DapD/GlmU-related protein [Cyanobacteria bacterium J06650_10]
MGLAMGAFVWLCLAESLLSGLLRFGGLLFLLYALPVLTYWLHNHVHQVTEGVSYLRGKQYSPWWGAHQIQAIYIAFPILETVLRLVPGAFSAWLRLWGAQIGKGVYWGSIGEIADRGLLKVGDHALIGHRVGFYAHIIKPKRDNLLLYVKAIEIGENAFVGSGSYIGAGVVVTPGAYLESGSEIHPNKTVTGQKRTSEPLTGGHLVHCPPSISAVMPES